MFRTPNPGFPGANLKNSPHSSQRPTHRSYTFPNHKPINTIDEDAEFNEISGGLPKFSLGDFSNQQVQAPSTNPFEKSFQSVKVTELSTPIESESPLVSDGFGFSRPPMLHSKNDSRTSINSVDTFSSFRTKGYSSCSSISSASEILALSSSSLPTLSSFKKNSKFILQDSVKLISNEEVFEIIQEEETFLVVDVRPFIEFNKSHLKGAINFNLPSTLLKRSNFTLQKCLNNLSLSENFKLRQFLFENTSNKNKKIIIYDDLSITNNEISLAIHGSLNKFLEYDDYNGELFVLKNGFQSCSVKYPEVLESVDCNDQDPLIEAPPPSTAKGHSYSISNASMYSNGSYSSNRSISLANLSTSISPQSANFEIFSAPLSLSSISSNSPNSPNLSRFQLPKLPKTPIFKIRHNEESYDFQNYKILNEFKYLNSQTDDKIKLLPSWLKNLLPKRDDIDVNIMSHGSLIEKFKFLEMEERNRINEMITNNSIGCGIELGAKNRYKDIFPYEHSRVKLVPTPTSEVVKNDDSNSDYLKSNNGSSNLNYINANFISCPDLSSFKYIATQAPLFTTLSDFNKLVNDNNIEIIIALTNQFENGVEKCYPYWDEKSIYEIIEEEKLDNIIIRRLKVTNSKIHREIIQIQILNWLDYDIMINSQQGDILKLIYFKRLIMEKLDILNENVLVHCSAGCGRTGTFCTLDTIININDDDMKMKSVETDKNNDKNNNNNDNSNENNNNENVNVNNCANNGKEFDPIFNIVEKFRHQRISMVQNLRQYLFIYDCLCNYFENFDHFEKFDKDFKNLNILNNFVDQKLVYHQNDNKV